MEDDDTDADAIRTILVATDGSDAATRALERAVGFADRENATVHVLSVVDSSTNPMKFGVAEVEELHETQSDLVDDVVGAVADRDVEVTGAIRRGRPADTILAYAEDHDVDLVVVGRTGRRSVADALLGSTADRLVREAPMPVVVVPAQSA